MAKKFFTYRSFNDKAIATELYRLLTAENIPIEWESSEGFFDPSFVRNEILELYYIKLYPEDFIKADSLLEKLVSENNEKPPVDYYLYSFSDQELLDVVSKPHEWNVYDCLWAEKILKERGKDIDSTWIAGKKKEYLEELKKPWRTDKWWILLAFIMILLATYFFHIFSAFGLVFLGLYIGFSKKTIPDGSRVMAFSENERSMGKIFLIIGLLLSLYFILLFSGVISWYWVSHNF
jgi:hypothetical protein